MPHDDEQPEDRAPRRPVGLGSVAVASRLLGALVAVTGAVHLAAWLSGAIAPLGIHVVTVKTNAALSLLLLGGALALRLGPGSRGVARYAATAAATLAAVIGAATLFENLFDFDVGIDQLIVVEPPGALGVSSPNRMGTPTAAGVLLGGLAVLHLWRAGERGAVVAQRFALGVALLGLLSSVGYLYNVQPLYRVLRLTAIALPAAISLLVLAAALLCARPGEGLMRQVMAGDPGGSLFRRLLTPMTLVVLLTGWLRLAGERRGYVDPALGTALVMLLFMVMLTALLYVGARHVSRSSHALMEAQAERERLHQQVSAERERLQTVLRRLPAGVVIAAAPAGEILYANDYAEHIFGHLRGVPSDQYSERWSPRHPDGSLIPREEMPVIRALRGESVSGVMVRIAREEGWVDLSMSAAPLRDRRGKVTQAVVTFEDVTARRLVEEALTRSEAQLRAVVESLAEGLIVAALDGRVTHWNQAALRMHGFDSMDDMRRHVSEFANIFQLSTLDEAALPQDQWPLPRILRGEALQDWELRIRRLHGDWQRVYSYGGTLVRDNDGHPIMAVVTIGDVTRRKEAEERLRRSEEQFRSMFESAAAGMAVVALDTTCFVRVNRQLAVITGYSEEELQDLSLLDLTHPEEQDAAREGLEPMRRAEVDQAYFVERRCVRKDGEVIDVELHGSVVDDGSGEASVAVFVLLDVTERTQTALELAGAKRAADEARAQAEEASRAKDHFLSVLSHELRTPLSPILTGISLLEGEADVSRQGRGVIDVIRRNVELEARLIDDLLDLTRITRGKVELDRRQVDLCTVIDRAVEVCGSDIEARGLHFAVDRDSRPLMVSADAARLQQVFWNLLKNAIKFTPKGGCVGMRCFAEGGRVAVQVTDSGIGIDASALPKIFDAFAQAERSITRQFGGLGLGLAISKALVEMHGGTIEAASPGHDLGATFTVRLPLLAAEAIEPRGIREVPLSHVRPRALRVLLVEDHGDTAEMMKTMLELAGHEVRTAGDVASALEAVDAGRPFDLVVSDLGLPDRSGLDLVRELRARRLALPAIALSGYGQERDIEQSRAAGFAAHLVKPAEPRLLLETMERVVRGTA